MGKHEKKTTERKSAPVPTGHDKRAETRSKAVNEQERSPADAPDGVSGTWD